MKGTTLPDFEAAFIRGLEYWANTTGYAKRDG